MPVITWAQRSARLSHCSRWALTTTGSTAAVRRVTERTHEQRHVILLGIANLKHDFDERMEGRDAQGREVRPRIEAQAVRTGGGLPVAGQQIRYAPVGVAARGGELGPTVARAARQRDCDARRGPPPRDVQDVRRDPAHEATRLSRRSSVVLGGYCHGYTRRLAGCV